MQPQEGIKKHCKLKVFCKLTHVQCYIKYNNANISTTIHYENSSSCHFVTVVSPPSNTSLVPEADSAFQFGKYVSYFTFHRFA